MDTATSKKTTHLVVNLAVIPNLPDISREDFRTHPVLDILQLLADRAKVHGKVHDLQIVRVL